MDQRPMKKAHTLLTLEECLAVIPASVAKQPEARDYVDFFCGPECALVMDRWNDTPITVVEQR